MVLYLVRFRRSATTLSIRLTTDKTRFKSTLNVKVPLKLQQRAATAYFRCNN